ncbi:hypothetical protein OG21DRAFT_908628 [Imleria badia]|nr:hypothetical protein OG21DRAFT_908628 [Imleria badia]
MLIQLDSCIHKQSLLFTPDSRPPVPRQAKPWHAWIIDPTIPIRLQSFNLSTKPQHAWAIALLNPIHPLHLLSCSSRAIHVTALCLPFLSLPFFECAFPSPHPRQAKPQV